MQLHLNKDLRSVFVLEEFDTMLKGMINDPKFNSIIKNIDSIDLVRTTIDPVQVFIDYWMQDVVSNPPLSPERQQYIKNALYAVKGAPEVFNTFSRCFEIQSEWEYKFPIISMWNIETIIRSNVTIFIEKLKYLLYHLLYYNELNLYIKNLIYHLIGDLTNNHAIAIKGFKVIKTEWSENDIF
jgi:hypothetical protein